MARVHGAAALKILARVFGSLGLVGLGLAGLLTGLRSSAIGKMQHAEGTVIALHGAGRGFRPTVQFDASGTPVRFESPIGSNPPAFRVGEQVAVLYPPDAPQEALIDSFWSLWFGPTLAAMIGAPFALIGALMFVLSPRRERGS